LRLLFLAERYPPDLGGVATSAFRISRALASLGVAVDVITWTRSLQPGVVTNDAGNPAVYRMGRFREWDTTMPHTMNLVDRLCSLQSYDAVWGHYLSPAGFLAAWTGRLKGIRSAVSIRGNDLDRDMFPPGDFARLRWTLENADCITAVTGALADKVAALCGRNDVIHLHNAVDHETFKPLPPNAALRESLGIRADEAVLGFAGELREKKGLQYLIRALRAVQSRRPACLLVIGEVRPSEMPRLMQWIPAGDLMENRIVVTGQIATPAQVNEHLQLCDVYLQPSLWDGMPNALLEAMAAGCGAIGSDAGGIPEIITAGADGIIIPRWQLHRLGDAVLEWLDADPEHRTRVRRAARQRVISEFGLDKERRELQAILETLIPNCSYAETKTSQARSQE
jgi:glycosyltransferase involved in cell wall biosynthesis